MLKYAKKNKSNEHELYIKILDLSRNKLFYTKLGLHDTFQNRVYLIFLHASFLFTKIKQNKMRQSYKDFYQKVFDLIFKQIELNMRELGYGDVIVNKNMKFLVKNFYNVLLYCENYSKKNTKNKSLFLSKFLNRYKLKKSADNVELVQYFDKYQAFCFDLSQDSVSKGDLYFNYK